MLLVAGAMVSVSGSAAAHEPIFGLGPHTIYQGGVGLEVEAARESAGEERIRALHTEILYGVTPDLSITASVPLLRKEEGKRSRAGLGDTVFRAKWRFWRRDALGTQKQLALVAGVKLPTGDNAGPVRLGSGSVDFLAVFTGGYESRRWYSFGDVGIRINTEANGIRRGNRFFADVAGGIRPWLTGYWEPDLVLLVEANLEHERRTRVKGALQEDTGGTVVAFSPGLLLSYRNVMFKAGVQFPVLQRLNGDQERRGPFYAVAVEWHL